MKHNCNINNFTDLLNNFGGETPSEAIPMHDLNITWGEVEDSDFRDSKSQKNDLERKSSLLRLISGKVVSSMLGVSERKVWRMDAAGKIPTPFAYAVLVAGGIKKCLNGLILIVLHV